MLSSSTANSGSPISAATSSSTGNINSVTSASGPAIQSSSVVETETTTEIQSTEESSTPTEAESTTEVVTTYTTVVTVTSTPSPIVQNVPVSNDTIVVQGDVTTQVNETTGDTSITLSPPQGESATAIISLPTVGDNSTLQNTNGDVATTSFSFDITQILPPMNSLLKRAIDQVEAEMGDGFEESMAKLDQLDYLEEDWFDDESPVLEKRQTLPSRPDTPAPATGCELYVIYGSYLLLNVSLPTNLTHVTTNNVPYQANATLNYTEVCAPNATLIALNVGAISQNVTLPPVISVVNTTTTSTIINVNGSVSVSYMSHSGGGSATSSTPNTALACKHICQISP
jgi:hypothetical protein